MLMTTSFSSMSTFSSEYSMLTSHFEPTSFGQQLTAQNQTQIKFRYILFLYFFYLFIHCYITTKITIKTKAKKTENTPHAAIHKSATVRPDNHGDIHHKTMLWAKVRKMTALMSVTDSFQDVTPYRLPRALKRYPNPNKPWQSVQKALPHAYIFFKDNSLVKQHSVTKVLCTGWLKMPDMKLQDQV